MKPKLATKRVAGLITRSIVLPTSALRNVNVVTRKLDLDQTSVAHTHTEKIKNKNKKNVIILPGTL